MRRAAQFQPEAEVCINSGAGRSVVGIAARRRRECFGEDGPRVRRADTRNKAESYIEAAKDRSRTASPLSVTVELQSSKLRVTARVLAESIRPEIPRNGGTVLGWLLV